MDASFSGRRHFSCEFQLTQGLSCWPEKGNSGSVCEERLVYQGSGNDEEGDDSSSYLNFYKGIMSLIDKVQPE